MENEEVQHAKELFIAMIENKKFQLGCFGFSIDQIVELEAFTKPYRDRLDDWDKMESEIKKLLK